MTGRFTTEDVTRTRKMNVYDPYGYYPDAALVGGVFRDEEKKQYVVEDPLGLNLYPYCHNNPAVPAGLLWSFCCLLWGQRKNLRPHGSQGSSFYAGAAI